ncbi:argininosuccinate lyase [Pendulispora albinea]|uniref:Argininosuccinate lyase n=1 Tax=Pendulispora albinea TaxID=2741071 RepID=A0ABZ2LYG0_9BACT
MIALTASSLAACGGRASPVARPPRALHVAKDDGARFGRTSTPIDPAFRAMYDFRSHAPPLNDAIFYAQTAIHRAHASMLAEQHILSPREASSILSGLARVDAMAAHDPALRAYMPYERALIRSVGPIAGKLNTGRSRNDMGNAERRIYYRDRVNVLVSELIAFRTVLVDKAAENLDTVMVAHTHRKQAQPITLGHYLMAHAESVGKSIQRYEDLYKRLNLSPLGSAATAGTGFPLNRSRTAELLGFDGLVTNSIEGVAGWDHVAELAAANSIYMSSLARLASEIQNWQTDEFNDVELDDGFAGTSSIMPQKKNPDSLEYIKLASAETMGVEVSILASLNAIEYQHSDDRAPIEPRALEAVLASTRCMAGIIRTLHANKEIMRKAATEGFATMTELADTMVRKTGIPFREAHEIVARTVTRAAKDGIKANEITLARVQSAAHEELGHDIALSEADVREALDPMVVVERRATEGGPAPSSVKAMIETTRDDIAREQLRLRERTGRIEKARAMLDRAVRSWTE